MGFILIVTGWLCLSSGDKAERWRVQGKRTSYWICFLDSHLVTSACASVTWALLAVKEPERRCPNKLKVLWIMEERIDIGQATSINTLTFQRLPESLDFFFPGINTLWIYHVYLFVDLLESYALWEGGLSSLILSCPFHLWHHRDGGSLSSRPPDPERKSSAPSPSGIFGSISQRGKVSLGFGIQPISPDWVPLLHLWDLVLFCSPLLIKQLASMTLDTD